MKNHDTIEVVEKFNPNHDALGRFASSPGGGGAAGGKFTAKDFQGSEAVAGAANSLDKELKDRGEEGVQSHKNGGFGNATLTLGKFDTVGVETKSNGDFDCYRWNGAAYKTPKYLCDARSGKKVPDYVDQVGKSADIDEIEVVEKFNPFHDSHGRFSNKNSFASYSANPNTKAGAMAIARSAAAGHGNTANVHRESYGENIRQNANWLGHHNHNVGPRQTGSGTLRQRVEPVSGLAGASAHGYTWAVQNRMNNRTTSGKQPAQQPQKPAAAKQPQPQQKPAQQQQNAQQQPQTKPASDRKPVDGQDISASYKYDSRQGGNALNQVAKQQGYDGKPTVVKDRAEFSKAVQESGIMDYRTINAGNDVVTGKHKTGAEFANDLKNGDTFSHNGSGGRAFGSGIYIAATSNPVQGIAPSRSATNSAKSDSQCYGYTGSKTVGLTLTKDAKVGDYNQLYSDFSQMHPSTRNSKYGPDRRDGFGAFCASKGYDAVCAKNAGYGCDYIVVYNRTKLVIFDG